MGHEYRPRAAKRPAGELVELGSIAAESHCRLRYSGDGKILHRSVAAPGGYLREFVFHGLHEPADRSVAGECRPEVDSERQLRAEDVLLVRAGEKTDVVGGRAEDLVLREAGLPDHSHEVDESLDCAYAPLGIAGVAALAQDPDVEGFGAFAGRDHAVVGRLADDDDFAALAVPGIGFRSEGSGLFAGEHEQGEPCAAFGFKPAACFEHGEYLAFGVAAAAAGNAVGVELWRDVRRDCVQVGAEVHFRLAPFCKDVDCAVSHFE